MARNLLLTLVVVGLTVGATLFIVSSIRKVPVEQRALTSILARKYAAFYVRHGHFPSRPEEALEDDPTISKMLSKYRVRYDVRVEVVNVSGKNFLQTTFVYSVRIQTHRVEIRMDKEQPLHSLGAPN